MEDPDIQESGDARRRSMLPQLTTKSRPVPNTMRKLPLPEPGECKTEKSTGTLTHIEQSIPNRRSNKPPPNSYPKIESSQGRQNPHLTPHPLIPGSLRRSSSVKGSTVDPAKVHHTPALDSTARLRSNAGGISSHGRSLSQQVGRNLSLGKLPQPSRGPSSRKFSIQDQRPAFSVMQQRFSPKKVSSEIHVNQQVGKHGETDSNIGWIVDLQLDLAQLHLMHRNATTTLSQWEESAKSCLQSRFDDLCARNKELKEIAHQQQNLLNQVALVEWCQGKSNTQVAEKVQQLSRNMADVRALLESEGKYTHIIGIFQSWFAQARRVQDSRDPGSRTVSTDLTFIEGIGDGWKAEAMVLERELTYLSRDLKDFGEIRSASSLGRILSLYRNLVTNLLHELDLVQWIENETMVQESAWMEETVNKLSVMSVTA